MPALNPAKPSPPLHGLKAVRVPIPPVPSDANKAVYDLGNHRRGSSRVLSPMQQPPCQERDPQDQEAKMGSIYPDMAGLTFRKGAVQEQNPVCMVTLVPMRCKVEFCGASGWSDWW
jgi:hypothetical protein